MQPVLAGTFRPRQIERSAHERLADLPPARRGQHGEPLDLNGPAAIQPAQTQGPYGAATAQRQKMAGLPLATLQRRWRASAEGRAADGEVFVIGRPLDIFEMSKGRGGA